MVFVLLVFVLPTPPLDDVDSDYADLVNLAAGALGYLLVAGLIGTLWSHSALRPVSRRWLRDGTLARCQRAPRGAARPAAPPLRHGDAVAARRSARPR